jgi:predicted anti-sigma-YlaC factor YlaD
MSLTCAQARVMASDLLDESLTEEERAAVLDHIETCTSCPNLYQAMAAVYQHMRTAAPATPPEELRRQVRRLFGGS